MLLGLVTPLLTALGQVAISSEFTTASVQSNGIPSQTQSLTPILTLQDALARAQRIDPQFQSAVSNAKLAHEDRLQSRAARLPSLAGSSQYLNTQGNGIIPTGRFVTSDGVHVYREWGVVRQDLSPTTLTGTAYKSAIATEAVSQTKAEKARLTLAVTVTKAYYTLVVAQRKQATAQQSLEEADRSLAVGQRLERAGRKPSSDVVKFQLQQTAQEKALREAKHSLETARLDLAVLVSSNLDEPFEVVDDLNVAPPVPSFSDLFAMAEAKNPDVRVAMGTVRVASLNVSIAHQAFLPSAKVEVDYGIEASCVGLHCVEAIDRTVGPAPTLGYFMTAVLTLPVWDWGVRKSKLQQSEIKREQANLELSAARRQLVKDVRTAYDEVETARGHLASLRRAADLAAEGLRQNIPRYEAGEATALELVDAHNSLMQARNALYDGELRYRVAVATLQSLTGIF
ncbi:MAG TPA: TolC family protein [Candidatus Acidoferrum sp.]|nr:TolC family protein [Candidatus Acidoferrum sp.]